MKESELRQIIKEEILNEKYVKDWGWEKKTEVEKSLPSAIKQFDNKIKQIDKLVDDLYSILRNKLRYGGEDLYSKSFMREIDKIENSVSKLKNWSLKKEAQPVIDKVYNRQMKKGEE